MLLLAAATPSDAALRKTGWAPKRGNKAVPPDGTLTWQRAAVARLSTVCKQQPTECAARPDLYTFGVYTGRTSTLPRLEPGG